MAVSANRLELLQIADAVAREKAIDRGIVIAAANPCNPYPAGIRMRPALGPVRCKNAISTQSLDSLRQYAGLPCDCHSGGIRRSRDADRFTNHR